MIMLITHTELDKDGLRQAYIAETKEAAMKRLRQLEPRLTERAAEALATPDPEHRVRWRVFLPDGAAVVVKDLLNDESGIKIPSERLDG